MKAEKYRDMTDRELQHELGELKKELFNLRFQQAIGELDNPMRLNHVKKDVARALTVIRERELSAEGSVS